MTYNQQLDYCLELAIQGKADQSEALLRDLLKQQPNDPRVLFNLGWHDFRHGDLQAAFEKMVYGRHLGVFGSKNPGITKPIWKNQELTGKFVLFNSEGGYGDQIINLRFAKNFNDLGAKVIVSCSKHMFDLFKDIEWIHQLVDLNAAAGVYCDYWIPAMNAPQLLNMSYDDLWTRPYINHIQKANIKSKKLKVGLRWSGNPKFEHEQHRKFEPQLMLNLCRENTNVDFYSLQKDNDIIEDLPDNVTDLQHTLLNWTDTAKIIADLDLVISSCTSVAHLAAAMGKPTWIVIPALPYYVWSQPGNKSKWYGDNLTLYRQQVYGDWQAPFDQIKKDLRTFVNEKTGHISQNLREE